MNQNTIIKCLKCRHYYATFDPIAPRGCKLYKFKSAIMPYILVKNSTGSDCTSFEERPSRDAQENELGKKNFNDPKYWGDDQ